MGMMKYPPPIALVAVLSWNVGLCAASAQGATTASAPAPQAPAAQLDLQGHVTFCDRYAASEFDVQSPVVGLPFNRIDPKAAIPACREALSADPHSARLSYQLGRAYAANGDYSKALEFFSKAADAHFALAQLNVGALYFSGLGASKDDQKAAKWIQLAADQGLAPAEGNLGEMYLTGQGVAQDYGQAAHWLDLAAAQGYAPAQASLATLYAAGLGVKQDFDHARALYARAASQGYAPSLADLGSLPAVGQNGNEGDGAAGPPPAPPSGKADEPVQTEPGRPGSRAAGDDGATQAASAPDSPPASNGAGPQPENPNPSQQAWELALKSDPAGATSGGEAPSPVKIALELLDHRSSSGVPTTVIKVSPLTNDFSLNGLSVNDGECAIYARDPSTYFLLMRRPGERGAKAAKDGQAVLNDDRYKRLALDYIPLESTPFNQPMKAEFGQYLQFFIDPSACDVKEVRAVVNGQTWRWRR